MLKLDTAEHFTTVSHIWPLKTGNWIQRAAAESLGTLCGLMLGFFSVIQMWSEFSLGHFKSSI